MTTDQLLQKMIAEQERTNAYLGYLVEAANLLLSDDEEIDGIPQTLDDEPLTDPGQGSLTL